MSIHAALGADLIDVFAGGHLDQNVIAYFDNSSQELRASVTGQAATFFDQARDMYQMITATDATQVLRNLQSKVENLWSQNTIVNLKTLQELQTAGPVMQRWIMANPSLRSMYLNNEVEGYAGSYENLHGELIAERHYDYRQVTDGIVMETADGYKFTQYVEHKGDDPDLTLYQKVDILRTWAQVEHYLTQADEDITSPTGNKL